MSSSESRQTSGSVEIVDTAELDLRGPDAADVAVFALQSSGKKGAVPAVRVGELSAALAEAGAAAVAVFVHRHHDRGADGESSELDPETARLIELMLNRFDSSSMAAMIRRIPAVDALKRIGDGVAVETVDRNQVNLFGSPEVVDWVVLDMVLSRLADDAAVNPTIAIATAGETVRVEVDD